jgi:tol-pal system-associated acyl-CoA thioesterase
MIVHPEDSSGMGEHRYAFRVYYEDTDAGGVVYHANYLRFCERARTEAMRDAGIPHAEMTSQHGLMFMVRRVKLDYLAPALLDDSLVVVTRPLKVGAASAANFAGGAARGRGAGVGAGGDRVGMRAEDRSAGGADAGAVPRCAGADDGRT